MTHGGMGYAKEYVVERLLREVIDPKSLRDKEVRA